jgi:hypothetical protein
MIYSTWHLDILDGFGSANEQDVINNALEFHPIRCCTVVVIHIPMKMKLPYQQNNYFE